MARINHYRGGHQLRGFSIQSRGTRVDTYTVPVPEDADLEWLAALLDTEAEDELRRERQEVKL